MTKQGQCSPLGGGGPREVSLWKVCEGTRFPVFPFHIRACAARRLRLCPCVSNARMCGWRRRTRVRDQASDHKEITGSLCPPQSASLSPPPHLSHVHTSVSLIYVSSYFYPASTSPSVSLLTRPSVFLPAKPMLHVWALTFEQKPLRTSKKKALKSSLSLSLAGWKCTH